MDSWLIKFRETAHSSFCSIRMQPRSRRTASSLGNMPTTSARLFRSRFKRSRIQWFFVKFASPARGAESWRIPLRPLTTRSGAERKTSLQNTYERHQIGPELTARKTCGHLGFQCSLKWSDFSRHRHGLTERLQFPAETCQACPYKDECLRKADKARNRGRTIELHPQEELLQKARQYQATPAFREDVKARQVVEHRQARMIQLGARQARYIGAGKTKFQCLMIAMVANLTLSLMARAISLPTLLAPSDECFPPSCETGRFLPVSAFTTLVYLFWSPGFAARLLA